MQTHLPSRDLVLVGAGHTNMHIVRMWRMQPIPDVRLTLISPFSRATYSGMLPGTLAGLYEPEAMEVDLYRLGASCGIRVIVEEVTGFDPQQRKVLCAERPPIRYDIAAIGIGSVPSESRIATQHEAALSIKPMATFRQRLESQLAVLKGCGQSKAAPSICVIGSGAAGIEVMLCLQTFLQQRGFNATFHLIDSGDGVLKGYGQQTRNRVQRELTQRGIQFHARQRVASFDGTQLVLTDDSQLPADLVIWATSAAPPPVLENFHLPKADDGFLAVRPTLQSTGDDSIFVVGDTATLVDHPIPKAGVYAVREGPVLWENIQRLLRGETPISFQPQKGFLSLLASGDGRAFGQYKGFSFHSRWAWKWKDHIDRKFMRMYQDYRPMADEAAPTRESQSEKPAMRCRGCGGKVGANVLSAALERLDITTGESALLGLNEPDDAVILNPAAGVMDVVSVDFFQAFLDDPYFVGRVAALNALSDVWAMGGNPRGAMAMVNIPEGHPRQQTELLYQLLAGGQHEFDAAGVTLLGGHTTEGDDLTIGYTVLGQLEGKPPLTKGDLRPGDQLILTKTLGTGVLLAAHAECLCRAEWIDRMFSGMLCSNAAAARIARECGVLAMTDVTGFGLAGHLLEMLDASGIGAELSLESLPLLPGFAELSAAGIRSSLDPANRENESRIEIQNSALKSTASYHALFDPQTSGGLLIGIAPDAAEQLLNQLRESGDTSAVLIGQTVTDAGVLRVRQ